MPTYVSLIQWTDQGIKNFKDSTRRAKDFSDAVQKAGGKVREILWTVGQYDLVSIADFPDDESLTATLLQIGALGNIRTNTMRAFDSAQMDAVVRRTG